MRPGIKCQSEEKSSFMRYTEKELREFADPVSASEDEKCQLAIRMVRDALKGVTGTSERIELGQPLAGTLSYTFNVDLANSRKARLLVQGSYANKTNIPSESDVDIAVILESTFWGEYPSGTAFQTYGFLSSSDTLESFKDDVETSLVAKFGRAQVNRCNKHIEVRGNTVRVDADAVPCGRHRDYRNDLRRDANNFVPGVRIQADDGTSVINYPEQHIKNGVEKNLATGFRFKKIVRIIKSIRVEMEESGYDSAKKMGSFVIESLLWNVPNSIYTENGNYVDAFPAVVKWLCSMSIYFPRFKEINGIKNLGEDDATRIGRCERFVRDLKIFCGI